MDYFVSPVGSDTNNGLGPDQSHATNRPYLTVGKALNTGAVVVPGDRIFIGPGIYNSPALVPIAGVSSSASPTQVRGDPMNKQGFKDGTGVRLAPGVVILTLRTAVEGLDSDLASSGTIVTGNTNGTNGLQWYDLILDAGYKGTAIQLSYATNADWIFEHCRIIALNAFSYQTGIAPTAGRNTTVRGCVVFCRTFVNSSGVTAAATADADLNILYESNLIFGNLTLAGFQIGAVAGNLGGGIKYRGNTIFNAGNSGTCLVTLAAGVSTVVPIRLDGNLIVAGIAVNAGTLGQVVDDGFNRFLTWSAHTNFTQAGTSIRGIAPMLMLPDVYAWGLEMPRMDMLGWGPGSVATQNASAWTYTGNDFRVRTARPWGGGASIGYVEAGGISKDTGSQITGGGANSLKITGAGEVSLFLPVDAVATTFAVTTESTTYGGTNWPQLIVMPNPSVGVTQQTATGTSAAEQSLTVGPFTPTGAGVVEVRLISRSTTVTSATYFDLLQVSV